MTFSPFSHESKRNGSAKYHETIVTMKKGKATHIQKNHRKRHKMTCSTEVMKAVQILIYNNNNNKCPNILLLQVKRKVMEEGDDEVYETELAQLFSEEDEVI